jgi:hypothetical protein
MRCLVALALVGCGFRPGAATPADGAGSDAATRDGPADAPRDAPAGDAVADAPADAPPPPPFRFVQDNYAEDTSASQESIPFTKAQAAGDLNVVFVGWYKTGTLVSVTDSSNNAYAVAVGPTMTSTDSEYQAVYYACGIAGAAAGSNAVKVAFQGSNQDPDVRIVEYSGAPATGCLDTVGQATGTTTAIDSTITTTHAHDLLVSGDKVYSLTTAHDASYTQRVDTPFGDLVQDREVNTAGAYHARATEDIARAWVMQIVAFRGT